MTQQFPFLPHEIHSDEYGGSTKLVVTFDREQLIAEHLVVDQNPHAAAVAAGRTPHFPQSEASSPNPQT